VLTYFDQSSATYRMCSLENPKTDWFSYRSLPAVLAWLFIALYEDELPDEEMLALAKQVGFRHAERLIAASAGLNQEAYHAWASAFPQAREA
jgi:hypothetical protein